MDTSMTNMTPAEMAVLRRSAAHLKGSALPKTIGAKLRYCLQKYPIVRKDDGTIAGFAREGFTLTPRGQAQFYWGEYRQFHQFINW